MTTKWKKFSALALFAAAAAAACTQGTDPDYSSQSLYPRYELAQYGGQPLPVVLDVTVEQPTGGGAPVQCEDQLTALSLDFLTRTRYSATTERLVVCSDGRSNTAHVAMEMGSYSVRTDSVRLTSDVSQAGVTHRTYALVSRDSINVYRREDTSSAGGGTVTDATKLVFIAAP